jgi:anti-anti-sigma factor
LKENYGFVKKEIVNSDIIHRNCQLLRKDGKREMLSKRLIIEEDKTAVVHIKGGLDRSDKNNIEEVQDYILRLLRQGHSKICLDLKQVDFIGSAAIGMFVNLKTEMDRYKATLTFRHLSDRAKRVLRLTQMDEVLGIYNP